MTYPGNIYPTEKAIRAQVIRRHMAEAGLTRAVCFTCGNAARALRDAGVDVLAIGPHEGIDARRWFTTGEIRNLWPDRFDATSGHLPPDVMNRIADVIRHTWPDPDGPITVPTGSGETIVALRIAYPTAHLIAAYDNRRPETTFHDAAPLNHIVRIVADAVTYTSTTAADA